MTEKERIYPVKTLHEFLLELDKEWNRFRIGSLLGLVSSGILFLIVVGIILRRKSLDLGILDLTFLILAGALLGYSIYAMYRQYRFFNRWERRIGLLLHLEEQMLAEKLDETKA